MKHSLRLISTLISMFCRQSITNLCDLNGIVDNKLLLSPTVINFKADDLTKFIFGRMFWQETTILCIRTHSISQYVSLNLTRFFFLFCFFLLTPNPKNDNFLICDGFPNSLLFKRWNDMMVPVSSAIYSFNLISKISFKENLWHFQRSPNHLQYIHIRHF